MDEYEMLAFEAEYHLITNKALLTLGERRKLKNRMDLYRTLSRTYRPALKYLGSRKAI